MTNSASKIVVGANGTVYVAPTGTTAPVDATTSLNAAFKALGFVSENGVQLTPSQQITPIMAWQSAYPVRKIVTSRGFEAAFTLREFNLLTIPFAFGGGTLTEASEGIFKYTPPGPSEIDERSLVVDWVDGTNHFRLYIPNGQVTDSAAFTVSRTAPAELPIKFDLNDPGLGLDPWNLFSDSGGLES